MARVMKTKSGEINSIAGNRMAIEWQKNGNPLDTESERLAAIYNRDATRRLKEKACRDDTICNAPLVIESVIISYSAHAIDTRKSDKILRLLHPTKNTSSTRENRSS